MFCRLEAANARLVSVCACARLATCATCELCVCDLHYVSLANMQHRPRLVRFDLGAHLDKPITSPPDSDIPHSPLA